MGRDHPPTHVCNYGARIAQIRGGLEECGGSGLAPISFFNFIVFLFSSNPLLLARALDYDVKAIAIARYFNSG